MGTRVFGVGEVARCLSCKAYSPKTEEYHVVDDVYVVGEVTKAGHDGAGDKDDQTKHCDGEIRGGQTLTPNKRHLWGLDVVGIEIDALIWVRIVSQLATVLPESRSEVRWIFNAKQDHGSDGNHRLCKDQSEWRLC